MKKRIAVVGCGYWGINYVRLISQLNDASLVAVCDQSSERLELVRQQFPGPRLLTNIDEVVSSEEVDAVVVCTNPTKHYGIAEKAIAHGKHVLVEKPITTNSQDARRLIQLSEKHNVVLMVGHIFLFNEGVRKAKDYIDSGEIGTVYYLYARRTNLGPIRPDVNALWDLAPHDVSIFNYLLDSQPDYVNVIASRFLHSDHEDVGFINLHYPGDIIGHIHVSWADPHKVRQMVIVGSDLRIALDDVSAQTPLTIYHKGVTASNFDRPNYDDYKLLIRDGDIIIPKIQSSEPLRNQFMHFLECLETGTDPLTNGMEGLKVVQVMEAINQSMTEMGAPIEVPAIKEIPTNER